MRLGCDGCPDVRFDQISFAVLGLWFGCSCRLSGSDVQSAHDFQAVSVASMAASTRALSVQ